MDQQNLYRGLTQDEALTQVRDEIDQIDQEIHVLLNKRAECAQRVADIKHNFLGNPILSIPTKHYQQYIVDVFCIDGRWPHYLSPYQ